MGMPEHRSTKKTTTIGIQQQQDGATSANHFIRTDVHDYMRHSGLADSLSVSCQLDNQHNT
jgi:hypothetical protein